MSEGKNMLKQIKILKSKKGLSDIVGYVLLITFAVIMGAIVYAWMNSYIFTEKNQCPDDISLIVKSYSYDCFTPASEELEIEFQNKGLFNISAFKIRGSTDSAKEKATIELPPSDDSQTGYHIFRKPLSPSSESQNRIINYNKITQGGNLDLRFIEITPYIFENGKSHICTNAMIKQDVACSACIDSDGGKKYFESGTTKTSAETKEDSCISNKLTEYFCNNDEIVFEKVDCTTLGSYTCVSRKCS